MSDLDFSEFVTPDELTQRVTLDEYYREEIAHHTSRRTTEELRDIMSRIEQTKARLIAHWTQGDEWWEWVSGTEPLMQSGGIALVRAGKIIYAEQHWIS